MSKTDIVLGTNVATVKLAIQEIDYQAFVEITKNEDGTITVKTYDSIHMGFKEIKF